MEGLRAQRIFSFDRPIEEVKVVRKTRKVNRKNAPKIPRKTLSKVEQDLKASYRKYVNSIRRKKSCRVKSFRAFANDRMGKKTRRSSRSVKSPVVPLPVVPLPVVPLPEVPVTEEMSLPESTPETTPVVSPSDEPSVEATEEMSLPESTPETTPVVSPDVEASPSVEESSATEAPASESEQKPAEEGGILKSVTDAFGLSSKEEVKKTGGRKRKGSAKSNKKKRNSRK